MNTRANAADATYANYELGKGVHVVETSDWETEEHSSVWKRRVIVRSGKEDESSADQLTRLTLEVQFSPRRAEVDSVSAVDSDGKQWGMWITGSERAMPREAVVDALAAQGEGSSAGNIGYYEDLRTLAAKVSGSRNWSEGEIFVFAESRNHFVVMKQVAPASCEMFTVTNAGFHDVLTAYRYGVDELTQALEGYMAGEVEADKAGARPVTG